MQEEDVDVIIFFSRMPRVLKITFDAESLRQLLETDAPEGGVDQLGNGRMRTGRGQRLPEG